MSVTWHQGTASALKTFWKEEADFREKHTDPHRTQSLLRRCRIAPGAFGSGELRQSVEARRGRPTGERRLPSRPPPHPLSSGTPPSRPGPAPQPSPRENPTPSSSADGARPPTGPRAGSYPPSRLTTWESRPQHGCPRQTPASPALLPLAAAPEPAAGSALTWDGPRSGCCGRPSRARRPPSSGSARTCWRRTAATVRGREGGALGLHSPPGDGRAGEGRAAPGRAETETEPRGAAATGAHKRQGACAAGERWEGRLPPPPRGLRVPAGTGAGPGRCPSAGRGGWRARGATVPWFPPWLSRREPGAVWARPLSRDPRAGKAPAADRRPPRLVPPTRLPPARKRESPRGARSFLLSCQDFHRKVETRALSRPPLRAALRQLVSE